MNALTEAENRYLTRILAALPPSDLAEYGAAFFLGELREALTARRTFSWCAELPEDLFYLHVAYPRINDEALEPCRALFRRELTPRLAGMTLPQAILEVNRWCAEQAAYRSTDERTSSAMEVYRRGWGRCGEETVFAVNALRSVGIAARQVYCPLWSHCDDNHAWVEVYDGQSWRFLGACEPEPVLDRGWFPPAASRAMLIHSREFDPTPGPEDPDLYRRHGLLYRVQTARYAPTRIFTVEAPPGSLVRFSLLNAGALLPIAEKTAGPDGAARLRLGLGSIHIRCLLPNSEQRELFADTEKTDRVAPPPSPPADAEGRFRAPIGSRTLPAPLPLALQAARRRTLDQAAALRSARPRPRAQSTDPLSARVLATLPEKDLAGPVNALLLQEAADALAWEGTCPEPVFLASLLCPRIGREPLKPWRRALLAALPQEALSRFREDPRRIWTWVRANFPQIDAHPTLTASPMATFALRKGNQASLAVLFCAICRCLGVPARLSPLDGAPEYWAGGYRPATGGGEIVDLTLTAEDRPLTLSRWDGDDPLLTLRPGEVWAGTLPAGRFRLLAAARLPNGDQLYRQRALDLTVGPVRAALSAPLPEAEDLLFRRPLPPLPVQIDGPCLLCFLEPGREPTEHLLLELAAEQPPCPIHLFLPEGAVLSRPIRGAQLHTAAPEAAEALARAVFAPPDQLPLSLLCQDGECRFAAAGYNVGVGRLLSELLERLLRKHL